MYYDKETIIYFNGELMKATDARTDLYGQSLHYGYAVFEGIRSYEVDGSAQIFKAGDHYERLIKSASLMKMPFEYSVQRLIDISYEVLANNKFTNAYIRPLVICSPNMSLSKGKSCSLAIEAWEWTNGYLSDKMRVMTSSYRRPNPSGFHIEAKVSGHYVNSILACQDAKDNGFDEALLLDGNGFVAEGPGANVFFEKDGILYTAPRGNILPGITRATILELCAGLDIEVKEIFFTPEEMYRADAAFFCGTAAEVVEIASLDNVKFCLEWIDTLSSVIQKAYRSRVIEKEILRDQKVA